MQLRPSVLPSAPGSALVVSLALPSAAAAADADAAGGGGEDDGVLLAPTLDYRCEGGMSACPARVGAVCCVRWLRNN